MVFYAVKGCVVFNDFLVEILDLLVFTDLIFPMKKNFFQLVSSFDFLYVFVQRKNCPHSEFLWSVFSRIRTEYGEIRSKSNRRNHHDLIFFSCYACFSFHFFAVLIKTSVVSNFTLESAFQLFFYLMEKKQHACLKGVDQLNENTSFDLQTWFIEIIKTRTISTN